MVRRLCTRATLRYLTRRLLAGLIDLGVLAGLQMGIVRAATALFPPTHPGHYFSIEGLILCGLCAPLAWFTYTVLPLAQKGQTLGKELMGLRVVNRKGRRPTLCLSARKRRALAQRHGAELGFVAGALGPGSPSFARYGRRNLCGAPALQPGQQVRP